MTKLIPLIELDYNVWVTSKGWAIGQTQQDAEEQPLQYQHSSYESAVDALEFSFAYPD